MGTHPMTPDLFDVFQRLRKRHRFVFVYIGRLRRSRSVFRSCSRRFIPNEPARRGRSFRQSRRRRPIGWRIFLYLLIRIRCGSGRCDPINNTIIFTLLGWLTCEPGPTGPDPQPTDEQVRIFLQPMAAAAVIASSNAKQPMICPAGRPASGCELKIESPMERKAVRGTRNTKRWRWPVARKTSKSRASWHACPSSGRRPQDPTPEAATFRQSVARPICWSANCRR